MKNKTIILSVILCMLVGVLVYYFISKPSAPIISVDKDIIEINCKSDYDDLLNHVSSNKNVEKYIEEIDIDNIIETKKVTFVVIDENGIVNKTRVPIEIDPMMETYSIKNIKETIIEQRHNFVISDYFEVVNGCGWKQDMPLSIEEIDLALLGSQEIVVYAGNDESNIRLETRIEIKEFETPIITLTNKEIEILQGNVFLFKDYVKSIEDNKDDEVELKKIMLLEGSVNTDVPGIYEVFITVKDSDGNVGRQKLTVEVIERPQSTVTPEWTPTPTPTWTPESGSGNTDNPSQPEQPENPDPEPENPEPELPENPDPEQPENPDPEQPENPDPEQPENPDPGVPEEPTEPSNPEPPINGGETEGDI